MDKKSKFGLDKSALKSSYEDFNNLVDLLKSNKSIQKKAIFEFENEKEPDKRVYNIHGLNNRTKQKVDGFINYNKLCFDVNKFMENEEKVNYDGDSLCSSFRIDHEMKKTYILADPRFLAGEKSETDANFYVLKINVKNEYTIDKISFDDVTQICNPEYEQLSTPGKIAAKEKVMQKVFGFEEISLVNESEGTNLSHKISEEEKLFDDFKEYAEKKDPNSMGILNAAKNDFDKLLKDKNGNPVNNLIGQKMLFIDPRVKDGTLDPHSPDAAFYFIKQNSPTSKPKFEKVSFNEVIDFVNNDNSKKIKKPHRGFFGTIADFFTKETAGRKKYEREKEVYYAEKCDLLETKFGLSNLKYNYALTNKEVAEKYINDPLNADVEKNVENGPLIPSPETEKFETPEWKQKRELAIKRLTMLENSKDAGLQVCQGAKEIKMFLELDPERKNQLSSDIIDIMAQDIGDDETKWEDQPKWGDFKAFCFAVNGDRADPENKLPFDINYDVENSYEMFEEQLKTPREFVDPEAQKKNAEQKAHDQVKKYVDGELTVKREEFNELITRIALTKINELCNSESTDVKRGAMAIMEYIKQDPEIKTDGCQRMVSYFSQGNNEIKYEHFCKSIGQCMKPGVKGVEFIDNLLKPKGDSNNLIEENVNNKEMQQNLLQ